MTAPPTAQDVADALCLTLERQDAAGAFWCPPSDGLTLRRWVTDRSAALGGGIRRVVRLARLMAISDRRSYIQFLYLRLPTLRARHFQTAFRTAVSEGRLKRDTATVSEAGVILHEPSMQVDGGEAFDIDFAQMSRLAGLLDILHNALGFTVVETLLAPVTSPGAPTQSANEVARALHAALNAWLSERLESTTHLRQAQRMREFLAAQGRVVPEAINDDIILRFWMAASIADDGASSDGFRLYSSAVSALLRYRQALRDTQTATAMEASLGSGQDATKGDTVLDRLVSSDASTEPWQSPLRPLARRPASRIKWLTQKEQHCLLNYLGGAAGDEATSEVDDEDTEDAWNYGLAGDERFDLTFWLTLMRADVFGRAQASIVARLRKRVAIDAAIAEVMAAIDDGAYTTAQANYHDLRAQLRLECQAAMAVLMEAGAAEAVILLNALGGGEAVRAILGPIHVSVAALDSDSDVAPVFPTGLVETLKAVSANPNHVVEGPGRDVVREGRAAMRKVTRVGFRREDAADRDMLAGLRAGATAIVDVVHELDHLLARLSDRVRISDVSGDRNLFNAAFLKIYSTKTID